MTSNKQYKYLNLIKIRLPIPGIVSFAHRVSGVLMFLAIPFLAYLLDQSVSSPETYQQVIGLLDHVLVKLALVIIGGLVSATILTLIVLPTLYVWIHERSAKAMPRERKV